MLTALLSFVSLIASTGPTPTASDTAMIVTTLGRDTIALERYERTPQRLTGDILLRDLRTVRYHYDITYRPDGGFSRSVVDLTTPGERGAPHMRMTIAVTGSTATVEYDSAGTTRQVTRVVSPKVMPALMSGFGSDYGLYLSLGMYQAIADMLPPPLDSVANVPVIDAANAGVSTKHLVRRSPSDVDVDYFRIAWTHLAIDAHGRIEGSDASQTTEKTHAMRATPISVDSALTLFARLDQREPRAGILSPPDSATGHVGSTPVFIRYNSPRKRGRAILGATVPFGQVWRTGADAATELTLGAPLRIGGTLVPAGTYTLWTLPTPQGATLIVNRQHGQWGTDYDSTQDLARVPMRQQRGQPVLDDFTISVAGAGTAAVLRMAWDDFVWTVDLAQP